MIRKATEKDIDRVAEIYENIFRAQEHGELTVGWVRGIYPSRESALEALERDELFVLEEDGVVAASAKINKSQGEEYRRAAWKAEAQTSG